MSKGEDNPDLAEQRDIFFTFTAFHHIIVESLLKRAEFSLNRPLIVNTSPSELHLGKLDIINFFAPNYTLLARIRMYRKIGRKLDELRRSNRIASVNSPHPHNILTNDLVLRPGDFPVNIYEDGTGNYCLSENTGHLKAKSRKKVFFAPLLGLRYRDYAGHFSGIDKRKMNSGYFLQPEKVFQPHRFDKLHSIELELESHRKEVVSHGLILVLDQNIESLFDKAKSQILREKMYNYVNSLGTNIIVKEHPSREGNLNISRFNSDAQEVDPKEAAEILALRHKPEYVISFFSSALKNIKYVLPESKCIALGSLELDEKTGGALSQQFVDMDVEVL